LGMIECCRWHTQKMYYCQHSQDFQTWPV